jgi:methyl-galactoside transport system substrate-binding protein
MQGTVLNDGVNQARATIELAVNAAKGNDVTEGTDWTIVEDGTKSVRVPYVAVTPENYTDFQ